MVEQRILELRIHGVNNTPPASMLGLRPDLVEQVAGDKLGSFWAPTAAGRERSAIPETDRREAYRWGEMARLSTAGASIGGSVAGAAERAGWALLLPFGLVNAAYWTRRLDDGSQGRDPTTLRDTRGAAPLRLAGLLLTLLMAATATNIAMDLVAVQCFDHTTKLCAAIPETFDFLAGWGQRRRIALMSLAPVVLIVLLWLLSALTRSRYEQPNPKSGKEAANSTIKWPVLRVSGFWAHRKITARTARLHVAATAAAVALGMAWHEFFGSEIGCRSLEAVFQRSCAWSPIGHGWRHVVAALMIALSFAALAWVAWSVKQHCRLAVDVPLILKRELRQFESARRVRKLFFRWGPFVLSLAVYAAQALILVTTTQWSDADDPRQFVGISASPTIILTLLLAIGLSGIVWRAVTHDRWRRALLTGWGVVFAALVASVTVADSAHAPTWLRVSLIVAAAVAVVVLLIARWRVRDEHAAWGGSGPGVFVLIGTFLGMLLSSAVAVVAGDLLNGAKSSASLADGKAPDPCEIPCAPPNLEVPLPYTWFGSVLVVFLALVIGTAVVAVRASFWRDDPLFEADDLVFPPVIRTRRTAALAHRAEPLVGWFAVWATGTTLAAVLIAASGVGPHDWSLLDKPVTLGMLMLAGGGLLFVALSAGGAVAGGSRPLGLVWDLLCFLPRTGHPLAPPCYAERVVPELIGRCNAWTNEGPDRTVILSAHSLGSVLAAAVIMSDDLEHVERISLLSYGTQLRAYFSRIFPELLGPEVLGTPPCLGASLVSADPWRTERTHTATVVQPDRSMSDRLGQGRRWRSLWRPTDYLGFPVRGYHFNEIDHVAAELRLVDYLWRIETHSDYPASDRYMTALDALKGLYEIRTSTED